MTYFEITDLFTLYGVDVAVLGIVTCAITQILKTTLLKKAPNKIYTFLPFIIGCVLYFCYFAAVNRSAMFALENFARVFERGLSVGAAATMVYVIYEQFVRGAKKGKDAKTVAIEFLLEGYFEGEKLDTVAQNLAGCGADGNAAEEKAAEILASAAGDLSAGEIKALSRLVAKTLAQFDTETP